MKDSQNLPKKNRKIKFSKVHFFDTVIILVLLNVVAVTLCAFYLQRLQSFRLPKVDEKYLKVKSIPLSTDLESINASAEAYVVFDPESRTIIAGKNQNLRFSPASTAKVMTAILALEHYDLDEYLTVPSNIYSVQGSKMNLVAGERVSVRDLLYGLLLPSGNDAAYTLAYNYPDGVSGFVAAMNRKAEELKLTNTYFIDPAGYEDWNFTTAGELARLGAYAMENKTFAKIVSTKSIQVWNKDKSHTFYLNNLNELLNYDDIVGIKTGFTNEAGGVLLTAINKNNKLLIVSVLKSQDRFADTEDIVDFIHEKVNYSLPAGN
jgi:D-alanyl-D-alanine carboxypeptidase